MRNKILTMTIALLTWMVGSAKADGLTVSETKMNAGTQKTVEVTLTQTAEKYSGFQFDVVLPEGLTLAGQALAKEQTGDMAVTKQSLDGGGIRFMVFSTTLALAHAGKVMELRLKADKKAEAGAYNLKLTNVVLSDADGNTSYVEDAVSTVTVTLPVTVTAKSLERAYGDEGEALSYEISENFTTGTPTISCEATVESSVGTYPIVVDKGSIDADTVTLVNGTLTITKAPLTIKAGTYTKKQGEALPAFTLTYEGFKNGETETVLTKQPTVSCEATEASAPNEYAVTVNGAEAQNYEISYVPGKLTVTDADPVTVTAKSYTRVYGDTNPTFEFTSEGAPLDGSPEISCEATATSPVGEYPIIIKKGGVKNYNDTYVNGTLTITKALLTVKVKDAEREQGEENPAFEIVYNGWKLQDTESVLSKQPIATTEATKDSPVGEYVITVSGAEAQNYEITYVNGTLTVTVPSVIADILTSGQPFDVYTVTGRKVRHQVTSVKGLQSGVYIVNGRKLVVK